MKRMNFVNILLFSVLEKSFKSFFLLLFISARTKVFEYTPIYENEI